MLPTIHLPSVFKCRARHLALIKIWRQVPKVSWLLALNGCVSAIVGWRMAYTLDPKSASYVQDERAVLIVLLASLACGVLSLLEYLRK